MAAGCPTIQRFFSIATLFGIDIEKPPPSSKGAKVKALGLRSLARVDFSVRHTDSHPRAGRGRTPS